MESNGILLSLMGSYGVLWGPKEQYLIIKKSS